jgi:glycine/D-amino acid oxidase-like deaminating enzyme/nitrite reductase/ring-hydroxylating ferredoxin subunit
VATSERERFRGSLWWTTSARDRFPALQGDLDVDVAIVGGGIVGVTTAHLLKTEGKRVALLEMGRIGQGTTGFTTAKLTVGQSLIYARLRSSHGEDGARLFAESNGAAIVHLAEIAEGIDCDWEVASNYVYTESTGRLEQLEEEQDAMRAAGIAAELTRETDLPFPVAGAIRVDDQAQFHPLKFLAGVVARVPGDGSHVFEATRAIDVRSAEPCLVETDAGRVRAQHVVLATQLPFLDRGFFFAKTYPKKSYAIAARADAEAAPTGMYINIDEPTRSIRSAPDAAGDRYLIVGGESERPGEDPRTDERYGALEGFMREHFGAESELRWSAHDYMPADGLPYIGRLRRSDERVFVATGFAKWGLTKGLIAARIVTDGIVGRPNPWAELYDPGRITPRSSAKALLVENAKVARHFLADRLRGRPGDEVVQRLQPGEGTVVRVAGRHFAVYRDDSGVRHVLSARCPHLGCLIEWSNADRTWECPCHGSRFSGEGALVQGPATGDLTPRDLPRQEG